LFLVLDIAALAIPQIDRTDAGPAPSHTATEIHRPFDALSRELRIPDVRFASTASNFAMAEKCPLIPQQRRIADIAARRLWAKTGS
jgi:hypothetical protein